MSRKVSNPKIATQARMQPIYRKSRSCGKVQFPNEVEAMIALASATRPGRSNDQLRFKEETRYYQCPQCEGWHLTARRTWNNTANESRKREIVGSSN